LDNGFKKHKKRGDGSFVSFFLKLNQEYKQKIKKKTAFSLYFGFITVSLL